MKTGNSSKTYETQGSVARRRMYRNRVIAFILSLVLAVCLVPVLEKTEQAHANEQKKTITGLGMEGIKEIYIYAENLKKIYAGAFDGVPADAKFYIKATATNCKKIVRMIKKSGFGKVDYTKI